MYRYFILLLFVTVTLLSSETAETGMQKKSDLQYHYYLEEESLDLQEILHGNIPWRAHNASTFTLASPKNSVWFKFDLKDAKQTYEFLQIDSEFLYLCDVYFVKDETLLKHDVFGVSIPVEQRTDILPRNFLSIDQNRYPTHIYVKILTMPILSVSFKLMHTKEAMTRLENRTFFNAVFYGVLLFLFIYNLVLYFFTRYKAYLPYLTYIVGISLYFLLIDEYFLFSLWPSLQSVYFIFLESVTLLTVVGMILFPMVLFKTKKVYPRLHHVIMIMFYFFVLLEFSLMFTEHYKYIAVYNVLYDIASLLLISILLAILFMALDLARQGKIIAIMYSVGWFILIVGIVNYILGQNSIFNMDVLTAQYYLKISIMLEGLLFSFILAYRIRELKERESRLEKIVLDQANMVQTEKMFAQIAHQWRYPLNTINSIIFDQVMQKEMPDKESWNEILNTIEDQTHYLSSTIEDFQYLHTPEQNVSVFTIKDAVDESLELLSPTLKDAEIEITVTLEKDLSIEGKKTHYIQVLLILLNNAIDVLSRKSGVKKIAINSKRVKQSVLLTIEDNGGGIEKSNLDKIFDLHFSTKKEKINMGMGLFMAKKFMEVSLNGSLKVKNGSEGACFTLRCCYA